MYTAASGATIANTGEKDITFQTDEGRNSMMNMHASDAQRPLLNVPRQCDVGHRVAFTSEGGCIQHEGGLGPLVLRIPRCTAWRRSHQMSLLGFNRQGKWAPPLEFERSRRWCWMWRRRRVRKGAHPSRSAAPEHPHQTTRTATTVPTYHTGLGAPCVSRAEHVAVTPGEGRDVRTGGFPR